MILKPQIAKVFKPLLAPRRYKGASGGRGSGKSHFFAQMGIIKAVTSHSRTVCGREVQRSIDESVKALLENYIHSWGLTESFKITDTYIAYPENDSLFVFKGFQNHTAASAKSMEGFHYLWLEEAQTITQRSWDIATPTFRVPGSEIWVSWNPENKGDAVDRFFRENANDPDVIHVTANYYDNPWFSGELRADMERDKRRDPDKYSHVWLGQYKQRSEARVFHNWEVREFDTPTSALFYHGADWGFSVDPTVLVRLFVDGRTIYVDREAYKVGCPIDGTPQLFDKLDPGNVGSARKWVIRADSARPETIDYMRRHGYPLIQSAVKGKGSVEDGIEFLKSYDIVVHPRCTHTINELSKYSWKVDKRTDDILPQLEDKENHVIDALRYALEGVRRGHYDIAALI